MDIWKTGPVWKTSPKGRHGFLDVDGFCFLLHVKTCMPKQGIISKIGLSQLSDFTTKYSP